MFMKMK